MRVILLAIALAVLVALLVLALLGLIGFLRASRIDAQRTHSGPEDLEEGFLG